MARSVGLKGQAFASTALTTIPTPPVAGNSYRNTSLLNATIGGGWPFSEIVNSADFNEFMYRLSALVNLLEVGGILEWSALTDYVVGAYVKGADNIIYKSLLVSGPNSGGTKDCNAGANPTYWELAFNYTLPTATGAVLGGIKLGASVVAPAGVLNVVNAIAEYGLVKKDGTKLTGTSSWTVSRNSAGKYQLVLPTGNYAVITAQAGLLFSPNDMSDSISAEHDTTTGYFVNNSANNIESYAFYDGSGGFLDTQWSFYAIKIS